MRIARFLFVFASVLPSASFAATYSAVSSGGGYTVDYSPSSDPMPLNKLFSIDIVIKPKKQGGRVIYPNVRVGARMPTHNHGMNTQIIVRKVSEGHYRADGVLLHMPGSWRITIDLTDERNVTEQVLINAEIEEK